MARGTQGDWQELPELIPTPINPVDAPVNVAPVQALEMNFQNITCDQILKVILIFCGMYIGYKLIT